MIQNEFMTDKSVREQIREMHQWTQEIHDWKIKMETQWNGGPGDWPSCKIHAEALLRGTEKLKRHDSRLSTVEVRIYTAMGVFAAVVWGIEHFHK